MIQGKAKEILETRLQELPPQITECLSGNSIEVLLEMLKGEYQLSDTQTTQISNEFVVTLTAFEPLSDLAINIHKSTGLPNEISNEIATAFQAIVLDSTTRELLKELNEEQADSAEEEVAVPPVDVTPPETQEQELPSELPAQEIPISTSNAAAEQPVPTEQKEVLPVTNKTDVVALERLRTMAQDADRIHGYGAYRRKYPTPEDARTEAAAPKNTQGVLTDAPKYTDPKQ